MQIILSTPDLANLRKKYGPELAPPKAIKIDNMFSYAQWGNISLFNDPKLNKGEAKIIIS